MPSSTFSSDAPAERAHGDDLHDDAHARRLRHGLDVSAALALTVFFALVGAGELALRAFGYRPSVTDDAALFALARHRATALGGQAVVVVGKSRAQLGIDGDTWRARLPHRPLVMLARHGESGWAVLEHLADDAGFTGTVLFSFTEEDLTRGARDQARALVDESEAHAHLAARVETTLRALGEERLVIASPQASIANVLAAVLDEGAPRAPSFFVTRRDRTQAADFTRTDAAMLRAHYDRVRADADRRLAGRAVPDGPWLKEARDILPLVDRLRARGARVVFVKFLHCDDADRASERWFPRARFFDAISREVGVPALHYRDLPSWERFTCPDSQHLDAREAPRFTAHFIDALVARGVVDASPTAARPRDGILPP